MNNRPTLTLMQDPVADAIDDLAALGEHWTRNRVSGRMPSGIRAAMVLVARELVAHAEMEQAEINRLMAGDARATD